MSASDSTALIDRRPTIASELFSGTLWLLRECIRLPVFLPLAILEPIVTFTLGSLALLGVLTALFWRLVGPPHFPFVSMLLISLGFGLLSAAYQALVRFLSR
jgi:hypothetical protein